MIKRLWHPFPVLILVTIVACIGLFIWAAVDGIREYNELRNECEPYADVVQHDVPARCISYWENK